MAGYSTTCKNCSLCSRCNGKGTIMLAKSDIGANGKWIAWHEKTECPKCRGVGGEACGKHD